VTGKETLIIEKLRKKLKIEFRKKVGSNVTPQFRKNLRSEMFKKTFYKFFLMKMRMKISYSAFVNECTIPELFFR